MAQENNFSNRWKNDSYNEENIFRVKEQILVAVPKDWDVSTTNSIIEDTDICRLCSEVINELREEKRQLGEQLLEKNFVAENDNKKCRCELKDYIDILHGEEACLIHTTTLKKQRIDALKESYEKLELELSSVKNNLSSKMQMYNDLSTVLNNTESKFNETCKRLKEKQTILIEMDKCIDKLEKSIKENETKIQLTQNKHEEYTQLLDELTKKCKDKKYELDQQQKMLIELDDVSVQVQAKSQNLKNELKMLIESNDIHTQEIDTKSNELHILTDEKQKLEDRVTKTRKEINAENEALQSEKQCKETLESMITTFQEENIALHKIFESLKKEKNIMSSQLKQLNETTENLKNGIEIQNEIRTKLELTIKDTKTNKIKVEEKLLEIVAGEKEKIKSVLEEIHCYEDLFKEAMNMKHILETDNKSLENHLLNMQEPTTQQGAHNNAIISQRTQNHVGDNEDLDLALDQHQDLLQALQDHIKKTEIRYNRMRETNQWQCCSTMQAQTCDKVNENDETPRSHSTQSMNQITRININYECVTGNCKDLGCEVSEIQKPQ